LTQEELEHWPEAELKEVASGWWQAAERGRSAPIQRAVHQRNAELTETLNASVRTIGGLAFKIPEPSAFERLTRDLSRQKSIFDFAGQSAIQKALEERQFAQPFSALA
jgi:hypothetical protein